MSVVGGNFSYCPLQKINYEETKNTKKEQKKTFARFVLRS